MEPDLSPPLTSPTIVIGGQAYTLKFSLLAKYELAKLRRPDEPVNQLSAVLDWFTAATAHNFTEAGLPVRTPQQWALLIGDGEKWQEVCDVTNKLAGSVNAERAKRALAAAQAQALPADTARAN